MKSVFLTLIFVQTIWLSTFAATGLLMNKGNEPVAGTADESSHMGMVVSQTQQESKDFSYHNLGGNKAIPMCCHADFTSNDLTELVYQFQDFSWSDSHIIYREWNFGDTISGGKNTSHQKNPVHEFSQNGMYTVRLIITSTTNCRDTVTKSITIGSSFTDVYLHGHVFNSTTGSPIVGQPVLINADLIHYSAIKLTNSSGIYQDTIPEVPSGTPIIVSVFDCNDSLHTQTVFGNDPSVEVNFSICALGPCKAAFSSRLDSNNTVQNTFIFADSSAGHPDRWIWTFGDGEESHDQNPVHSYKNPGQYQVCLTVIKKDLSGGILCSDSSCHEIVTPPYYNLGGLMFTGLYPINNPASTGDTGVAYIYRLQNSHLIPLDTITFTYLGYYAFLHLLEGSYLVKAGLREGSAHYGEFLSGYSGDQLTWQAASLVTIKGGSSFSNDIHLVQTSTSSGSGAIGGYISHKEKGPLVEDAEVILYNSNSEPISYTVSDENGAFEFQDLSFGKYFLYPEITGKYARIQEVTIDETSPFINGVVLEVSDLNFTGTGPWGTNGPDITIRVFPNPFSTELHVQLFSLKSGRIHLDVINLTGTKIHSATYNTDGNTESLTIPLENIPQGLYFLTVRSDDGVILTTRKVMKK